jgi:hypothetical protein
MLDIEHHLVIGKTRCEALDGKVFYKPGKEMADILKAWLTDGAPQPPSLADEFVRRFGEVTSRDELESLRIEAGQRKAQLTKPDMLRIKAAIESAEALLPVDVAAQGIAS